ncbi:hypothetical protein PSPO01_01106 [Paraphaeosphaeria sporulosa]
MAVTITVSLPGLSERGSVGSDGSGAGNRTLAFAFIRPHNSLPSLLGYHNVENSFNKMILPSRITCLFSVTIFGVGMPFGVVYGEVGRQHRLGLSVFHITSQANYEQQPL